MEYRVSRFPMLSRFFLTANEKDFSLSLEMTVWESGILASLPSHAGKALARGCGSPSFLGKEVPRRGGGWLTQRNKKEWIRALMDVRAAALHAKISEQFPIAENKRFQKYKAKFVA